VGGSAPSGGRGREGIGAAGPWLRRTSFRAAMVLSGLMSGQAGRPQRARAGVERGPAPRCKGAHTRAEWTPCCGAGPAGRAGGGGEAGGRRRGNARAPACLPVRGGRANAPACPGSRYAAQACPAVAGPPRRRAPAAGAPAVREGLLRVAAAEEERPPVII
jgi:hypothetical protein